MKKGTLQAMSLLLGLGWATAVSAAPSYHVTVQVNHVTMKTDVNPFVDTQNNRTYVPIRFVSEALGEQIRWEGATQKVTIEKRDGTTLVLQKQQPYVWINGTQHRMDAPVLKMNQRIMLPLRFVSEQLGATVEVKKISKETVVNIHYPDAPKQEKKETKLTRYQPFKLDAKYNKLAPHLFKNNFRVVNGEFVFTVPKIVNAKWSGASLHDYGIKKLQPGKEYRLKLGDKRSVSFSLGYKVGNMENIESYDVYLSPSHRHLEGEFDHVKNDVIVVCTILERYEKDAASPLSEALQRVKL